MPKPTVLITGGNGRLGRVLRDALPGLGWRVRTLDLGPAEPRASSAFIGSVTNLDTSNIDGTRTVLEAARLAGVKRVILASSCHAVGATPREPDLADDTPARPDSLYGVSKVAVEALGSLYAQKHGLETTSLRIGACHKHPTEVRTLSIWLSYPDFVRLIVAALTAPWNGHRTIWGVSRNTRRWWSYDGGRSIGFEPQDDAEEWADRVTGDEPTTVGGWA